MSLEKTSSSKFERIISLSDNIRKICVNIFLFFIVIVVSISLIVHYCKKQLLIFPFQLTVGTLKNQGYTGEIISSMVLDHMNTIKKSGSSYYTSQNIEIPSWDNGIDEFKDAIDNGTFTQVNAFIQFLFNKNILKCTGEIVSTSKDSLKINFRLGDELLSFSEDIKLPNKIADTTAEFIMEKYDPYLLAGYFISTHQKAKALRICQELLDQKDKKNYGTALLLRGTAYIDFSKSDNNIIARKILDSALTYPDKKRLWLIYNNIGITYYYQGDLDMAARMYKKSLILDPAEYGNYLNYANLLRKEYEINKYKPESKIDSAISFYKKSVLYNSSNKTIYLMLDIAYYDKKDTVNGDECFEKLTEMVPNEERDYATIGYVQTIHGMKSKAIANYERAMLLVKDSTQKADLARDIVNLKNVK